MYRNDMKINHVENNYENNNSLDQNSKSRPSYFKACGSNELSLEEINDDTVHIATNGTEMECQRNRSHSEGILNKVSSVDENFQVFPSLPDKVLQKMKLLGETTRENMNDDEMEERFLSLALAFTIDAGTIKDRCQRQRRSQDQTENNFRMEINHLIQKTKCMLTKCIDLESAEMVSGLLEQIELVSNAAKHVAMATERYGAVQHEYRLSNTVNFIIKYVNILKKQRDAARRQLQYTKKVLHNSANNWSTTHSSQNGRVLNKRRASIAAIAQSPDKYRSPSFRIRASSLVRNIRPSRFELSLDLVKIKEGIAENGGCCSEEPTNSNHYEQNRSYVRKKVRTHEKPSSSHSEVHSNSNQMQPTENSLIFHIYNVLKDGFIQYTENGTFHEIYYMGAIICFTISIVIMANVLLQIKTINKEINYENI